jgi:hypothetical protein
MRRQRMLEWRQLCRLDMRQQLVWDEFRTEEVIIDGWTLEIAIIALYKFVVWL